MPAHETEVVQEIWENIIAEGLIYLKKNNSSIQE